MTIKKAYTEIISLLEANRECKVKTIIEQAITLASAKSGGGGGKASSFHRDEAGIVQAIFCYYHKVWLSPAVIEFGKKASSATGFNSMCKSGTSLWTKQQRVYKTGKSDLLDQVAKGDVEGTDVPAMLIALEEAKNLIVPIDGDYIGFETLEDCLADLDERGMV